MILAAALVASWQCLASEPISSSADVAQDSSWLYVATADWTLQRISKATGERAAIAPPTDRDIASIDVDGRTVYYGTRTSIASCWTINDVQTCIDDGQSANQILLVPTTGGSPTVLVDGVRSVLGISHDATYVYWVEASTRIDTEAIFAPHSKPDGLIRRIDKRSGAIDTVAAGLTIPYRDRELVVFDNAYIYYTDSEARLVRYAKSDGVTATALPSWGGPLVIDDTHIYSDDEAVPKSGGFRFQWIDRLRIPDQRGQFTVVGAGGGRLIYSTFYAEHRSTIGTFYLYDFCSGTSTVLGGSSNPSTSFAIDSCAVYIGANNYLPSCAAVPVRITSVVPPTASASGGAIITVTGSGFLWSATADIDGAPAPIQSLTSTRIELATPSNTPRGTFLPLGTFLRINNGDGSCVAVPFVYVGSRRRVVTSR